MNIIKKIAMTASILLFVLAQVFSFYVIFISHKEKMELLREKEGEFFGEAVRKFSIGLSRPDYADPVEDYAVTYCFRTDETQVYLLNEQSLIEKETYADFEATGNTACLGIPFAFQTGVRISEYIFLNEKGRMKTLCLDTRIRKYCRHINISEKGMHKVRKTYISTLIDSENININYIREQVGHSDEQTTFENYCLNGNQKTRPQKKWKKHWKIKASRQFQPVLLSGLEPARSPTRT